MPYLPNQAPIPRQILRAHFECSGQTLPDNLKVLLCLLDGAERRQRVQAKLKPSGPSERHLESHKQG
jgi:hypothetical protein